MHRIPLASVKSALTYANTLAMIARTGGTSAGMATWAKSRNHCRLALAVS